MLTRSDPRRPPFSSLVLAAVVAASLATSASAAPLEALVADYEVGPLRIFQNDGRYGPTGTPYGAGDVGQRRNLALAQRLSVEWRMAERHALVLLYAPLDVTTRATLTKDIQFRDQLFLKGRTVDSRYLFDGVRASYLYRPVRRGAFTLDTGASFQVRNAQVAFTDIESGQYAVEPDIGLVFAVKARARYDSPWGLWAMLDADAISTFGVFGVGGALVDSALTLGVPFHRDADFFLRLRYVGGGADVPRRDLFNWAHLGSATIGVRFDFASLARRSEAP